MLCSWDANCVPGVMPLEVFCLLFVWTAVSATEDSLCCATEMDALLLFLAHQHKAFWREYWS